MLWPYVFGLAKQDLNRRRYVNISTEYFVSLKMANLGKSKKWDLVELMSKLNLKLSEKSTIVKIIHIIHIIVNQPICS